ncbi:MAG: DNA adenine methylase [Candidatus Dormibacteria bacterium]
MTDRVRPTAVDLFSGAGGLSLGLQQGRSRSGGDRLRRALGSVEFLGSKQRLLPFLLGAMSPTFEAGDKVVDLFCGTGSVSAALKSAGAHVEASDSMLWCSLYTRSLLQNSRRPSFAGIREAVRTRTDRPAYEQVLTLLNRLQPVEGFMYRSYSPASERYCGVRRMYFTEENAGHIDAIRQTIATWRPSLTDGEEALLISDLLRASTQVSNVAGTYGCYLKHWKPRALAQLILKPAVFRSGPSSNHAVHCRDAEASASRVDGRVVYADPPYTKRQYAAYYHILETIAVGDEPDLVGSTGLRPWQDKASDWCYRRKAPDALRRLLRSLGPVRHFFLSYNEDGQIPHDEVLAIMADYGVVQVLEMPTRRYKSSARPHRGAVVTERLYHLSLDKVGAA